MRRPSFRFLGIPVAISALALSPATGASAAPAPQESSNVIVGLDEGATKSGSSQVTARIFDYSAALPLGSKVPEYIVGVGHADATGKFSLNVDLARVPTRVSENNSGILNIELTSQSSDGSSGLAVIGRERSGSSLAATSIAGNARTTAQPADIKIPVLHSSATATEVAHAKTGVQLAAGATSYCSWYLQTQDSRTGKLFNAHSVSKTKLAWYYGATASSSTDGGIQYSPTGSWSLFGSYSVSNTRTSEQSASYSGSKHSYATTSFSVKTYKLLPDNSTATYCSNVSNLPGSKKLVTAFWLSGSGWSGTLSTISCGSSSAYNVPQTSGATFKKTSSRTQEISGGISTPYIGLGISSAYTTDVGLTVRYEWTASGYACGNNAYPPDAQYLYVG